MKIRNGIIKYLLLSIITLSFLLTGCHQDKKNPIVTINDKVLYMDDFLYEIYLVEQEGNQLEDYYQDKLGYSYWDYEYDGQAIRKLAKSSVLASVVMYAILSDQAKQKGIVLTKDELLANDTALKDLLHNSGEKALGSVGLTKKILTTSLAKKSLADKYRDELCKDFKIDENAIRKSLLKSDYKNTAQYEQAVTDAIKEEADVQFSAVYNKLKKQYHITINHQYWDPVTLGNITISKK